MKSLKMNEISLIGTSVGKITANINIIPPLANNRVKIVNIG